MSSRLVIEWTRTSLRAALAESKAGRWELRSVQARSLGPEADVAGALRALVQGLKRPPDETLGVTPREQVITRVVKFPSRDPRELAQMVELYAKAQLPYPREQTLVDFHVAAHVDGFSIVAIVAAPRDLVDRQLSVLRQAGLLPSILSVSSWGVLAWYQRLPRPEGLVEPCLVLNVDDSRADLVLIREGKVLSSRSVGQGAADWADAAEATELLSLEIERSRAAVRKELPGTEVGSILVTGLGTSAPWRAQLAERSGLACLVVEPGAPFRTRLAGLEGISPVVVEGLACRAAGPSLNLSPPELLTEVRHRRQVRDLVMVGSLVAGVLVISSAVLAMQRVRHQRFASRLERTLSELEPEAKQVQAKTRVAGLVGSLFEDRRRLAAILTGIFRLLPPTITLDSLAFERARGELVVRGSADSTQTVLQTIRHLEQLDGVARIELDYTTRRAGPSGERTDFELMIRQEGSS